MLSPTASPMDFYYIPHSAPLHPLSIPPASHAQPYCIPRAAQQHSMLNPVVSHAQPYCIPHGDALQPICSPHCISYAAPQHPMLNPTASHAQPHCIPHAEDIGQRLWGRSDDTLGMESAASSPAGAKCSSGIFSFLFILFFFFLTCLAKALSFASPAASFLLPQYGGFTAPNPGGAQGHPIPTPLLGLSPQCRSGHSAVGRSPPLPPNLSPIPPHHCCTANICTEPILWERAQFIKRKANKKPPQQYPKRRDRGSESGTTSPFSP